MRLELRQDEISSDRNFDLCQPRSAVGRAGWQRPSNLVDTLNPEDGKCKARLVSSFLDDAAQPILESLQHVRPAGPNKGFAGGPAGGAGAMRARRRHKPKDTVSPSPGSSRTYEVSEGRVCAVIHPPLRVPHTPRLAAPSRRASAVILQDSPRWTRALVYDRLLVPSSSCSLPEFKLGLVGCELYLGDARGQCGGDTSRSWSTAYST